MCLENFRNSLPCSLEILSPQQGSLPFTPTGISDQTILFFMDYKMFCSVFNLYQLDANSITQYVNKIISDIAKPSGKIELPSTGNPLGSPYAL